MIDQIKYAISVYKEENNNAPGKSINFKSIKNILPENQIKMIESVISFENDEKISKFLNQFESLANYDFFKDFSSKKFDDCKFYSCEIAKNEFYALKLTYFDKAEPIETLFEHCSSKNGVSKSESIRVTCDCDEFNIQHEIDYSGRTKFESEITTYEFENHNPLVISKKSIMDPESYGGEIIVYDINNDKNK